MLTAYIAAPISSLCLFSTVVFRMQTIVAPVQGQESMTPLEFAEQQISSFFLSTVQIKNEVSKTDFVNYDNIICVAPNKTDPGQHIPKNRTWECAEHANIKKCLQITYIYIFINYKRSYVSFKFIQLNIAIKYQFAVD